MHGGCRTPSMSMKHACSGYLLLATHRMVLSAEGKLLGGRRKTRKIGALCRAVPKKRWFLCCLNAEHVE